MGTVPGSGSDNRPSGNLPGRVRPQGDGPEHGCRRLPQELIATSACRISDAYLEDLPVASLFRLNCVRDFTAQTDR